MLYNNFTHLPCVPVSALLFSESSISDICSSFGCGLQWSGLKYIFTMRYFCSLTAPWPEWPRVCWGRLSPWDSLCSVCLRCQCTAAILLPSSCTAQVPTHRGLRCTGRGIVTTAYTGQLDNHTQSHCNWYIYIVCILILTRYRAVLVKKMEVFLKEKNN